MGKHYPNTCEPSKSHTSPNCPDRHIDKYTYNENGEKISENHGQRWPEKIMDAIDDFLTRK